MKILVCGGRDFSNRDWLFAVLNNFHRTYSVYAIIHGGASGADTYAGWWAIQNEIDQHVYPAKWSIDGKAAGPLRNERMLLEAQPDLVLAFPGGNGTAHMVKIAKEADVQVLQMLQPPANYQ